MSASPPWFNALTKNQYGGGPPFATIEPNVGVV
jgi:ribosome-binding ATPase YchF (GTP1/OBG family)